MRLLYKNMRPFWYALCEGERASYAKDEYGNTIYDLIDGENVPREIGVVEPVYSEPMQEKAFIRGIASLTRLSRISEYGLDLSSFDAYLYAPNRQFPFDERTLIWVSGAPLEVSRAAAEYYVARCPLALDFQLFFLKRQDNAYSG